MNTSRQTKVVTAYLAKHFVAATISSAAVPAACGWSYTVSCEEGQFKLLLLDEVFEGLSEEQAAQQLEAFHVAEVMRNMEGFAITVSNSGCIFQ